MRVVTPVPRYPLVVVRVEDDEHVDDRHGGRYHHDVLRLEGRPALARLLGRGLLLDGLLQRVAATAARTGHTVGVDEDRGPRLEDRLVAGGAAGTVTVVGHTCVGAQLHRRERPQVRGNLPRCDALHRGEGAGFGRVRLQRLDLLLHIARGDVLPTGVQPRRRTLHATRHVAGHLGGAPALRACLDRRTGGLRRRAPRSCRLRWRRLRRRGPGLRCSRRRGPRLGRLLSRCTGLRGLRHRGAGLRSPRRGAGVGRRRLRERVGPCRGRRLEEHLTGGVLATAGVVAEQETDGHGQRHDAGQQRDSGCRSPPGMPGPLPRTTTPGRPSPAAPTASATPRTGPARRWLRRNTAVRLSGSGTWTGLARLRRTRQRAGGRSCGLAGSRRFDAHELLPL